MKLATFIDSHRSEIEQRVKEELLKKESESENVLYKDAMRRLFSFSTSGKMIRGLLVLASTGMFGQEMGKVVNIAAAIELTHSGLLIHDDIIDDDKLRRGKKTIFAQYQEGHDKFYGTSMAICVADAAFYIGMELISKCDIDSSSKTRVLSFFATELQNVIAAEMEDFHFGATDEEPTEEQILNMYRLKSARYTFSLPLIIGAIIASKDEDTINKLSEFGENLGIVFQIVDDTLGVTGDTNVTGKPVGNDIKQNKKTLFRSILFKKVDPSEHKLLASIFGKSDIKEDDVSKVVTLSAKYGVDQEIATEAARLSDRARQILIDLDIDSDYRELLNDLIDYNLTRVK